MIVKNCVKQLTLLRGYIEKIVEDAKCCNFYFWVFTILGFTQELRRRATFNFG
ncbi:hypothetical protein IC582_025642 [Cucumis melo]